MKKIKNILLFYIEGHKRNSKKLQKIEILISKVKTKINKDLNWRNISKDVSIIIIKLAKKFPNINFIIKCKVGQKIPKNLEYQFKKIKNIDLIKHGLGNELIEKSQIILGLNSAATIETLLAKKLLMVPFLELREKY